jgi:hypothetical protein
LLATLYYTKGSWVAAFHRRLYPSSSGILTEDWGNITGLPTSISIRHLQAAPKLSDFPAGVWQTGDCSFQDWQNGRNMD